MPPKVTVASLVKGPPLILTVSPPAVVPYSGVELVIKPAINGSVFVSSVSLVSLVSVLVSLVSVMSVSVLESLGSDEGSSSSSRPLSKRGPLVCNPISQAQRSGRDIK